MKILNKIYEIYYKILCKKAKSNKISIEEFYDKAIAKVANANIGSVELGDNKYDIMIYRDDPNSRPIFHLMNDNTDIKIHLLMPMYANLKYEENKDPDLASILSEKDVEILNTYMHSMDEDIQDMNKWNLCVCTWDMLHGSNYSKIDTITCPDYTKLLVDWAHIKGD